MRILYETNIVHTIPSDSNRFKIPLKEVRSVQSQLLMITKKRRENII